MYSTSTPFQLSLRFDRLSSTSIRLQAFSNGVTLVDTTDTNALEGSFAPGLSTTSNSDLSFDDVSVWERGASCTNGILDGDEVFIDCGGACASCNDTMTMQLDFENANDMRGWSRIDLSRGANWEIAAGELRQNTNTGGFNWGQAGADVPENCRYRGMGTLVVYEGWGRHVWPDWDFEARMYNDDNDRMFMIMNYQDLDNMYFLEFGL